jgi:hypothetical protein
MLCISHIFRKESQKFVTGSKVELARVRGNSSDFSTLKNQKNRENLTELKWWREWLSGEIWVDFGSRGVANLDKSGGVVCIN